MDKPHHLDLFSYRNTFAVACINSKVKSLEAIVFPQSGLDWCLPALLLCASISCSVLTRKVKCGCQTNSIGSPAAGQLPTASPCWELPEYAWSKSLYKFPACQIHAILAGPSSLWNALYKQPHCSPTSGFCSFLQNHCCEGMLAPYWRDHAVLEEHLPLTSRSG